MLVGSQLQRKTFLFGLLTVSSLIRPRKGGKTHHFVGCSLVDAGPRSRLVPEGSTSMGWRKQWLAEQKRIAESKDTAQLVVDAMEMWAFLPQLKYLLPSQGWRRFRLMQIAHHRELGRRGIYPFYIDVVWSMTSIIANLR